VTQPKPESDTPRFIADVMLGSLARWLRVLGFDTLYNNRLDDEELIEVALRDGRIALTRDRRLTERRVIAARAILIDSDVLSDQLRQVLDRVGFRMESVPSPALFGRCIECNSPLEAVDRGSVALEVPPYVYSTQQEFKKCPSCGRIYWGGTHRQRMLEKLARLLQR